ncbi:Flp family type IVb pilin [Vibrio sp. PNB23_22_6]
MEKFTQVLKDFWNDEEGLTAVEYAVAGGVVTAGLVALFGDIGGAASTLLDKLKTNITSAAKP